MWTEGDAFGAADSEAEDDFMALREILFADLGLGDQASKEFRYSPIFSFQVLIFLSLFSFLFFIKQSKIKTFFYVNCFYFGPASRCKHVFPGDM